MRVLATGATPLRPRRRRRPAPAGIIAVPVFISNWGGVHLYDSVAQDEEPDAALAAIEALVSEPWAGRSRQRRARVTPVEAALWEARATLRSDRGAPRGAGELLPMTPERAAGHSSSDRYVELDEVGTWTTTTARASRSRCCTPEGPMRGPGRPTSTRWPRTSTCSHRSAVGTAAPRMLGSSPTS